MNLQKGLQRPSKERKEILGTVDPTSDEINAELFNLREFKKGLVKENENYKVSAKTSGGSPQVFILHGTDEYIEKWGNSSSDRFDGKKTNMEYKGNSGTYMPEHYRALNFNKGLEVQVQKNSNIYIRVQLKRGEESLKKLKGKWRN